MGSTMHISKLSVVSKFHADTYKDLGDNASVADPTLMAVLEYQKALTDGRGADSADVVYVTSFNLAAGANLDIDLNGGANETAFGDALAFAKLRGIMLLNDDTTDGDVLRLGGIGATGLVNWISANTAYVTVGPGMFLIHRTDATGYAVTAGTADILRITNPGSNAIAGRLAIWGCETDVSSSSSSSSSSTSTSTSSTTSSGSSSSSSTSTSTSSAGLSSSSSTAGEANSSSSSSSSSSVQESSESSSSSTTSSSSGA